MIGVQVQWFVLAFLLFNTVHGTTTYDFSDSEYLTRAEKNSFLRILAEFPVTADPFNPGNISLALSDSKFVLYNVEISGVSSCKVIYVSVDETDSTFELDTLCPQLVLHSDFVGEGTMGGIPCDGQGVTEIHADYKLIKWSGTYATTTSDDDQTYMYATESDVRIVYIENMSYKITSMVDQTQTTVDELNEYLSTNWKEVTTYTEPTFLNDFIIKVVDLYNDVLKTKVSLDSILALGNIVYGSS